MTHPVATAVSRSCDALETLLDHTLPEGRILALTDPGSPLGGALTRPGRTVVTVGTDLHADARELPFAAGTFAAAIRIVGDAGTDPVLAPRARRELDRVVRPGGTLVLGRSDDGTLDLAVAEGASAVRVRTMRHAEAPLVGDLTLRAYDRYGRIEGGYREFLADPLRRVGRCSAVLVAEAAVDGHPTVVGTVSYVVPTDPEWEELAQPAGDAGFRVLAVHPDHEGRGIGSVLVDACVERAREDGAHRLLIISMGWMHRAHELYQRRYGFERRPDLDVTFPNGLGVILTRDLTDEAAHRFPPPGPVPPEPPWYEDVMGHG